MGTAILSLPQEKGFKIATLNRYGYMFTRFDPLVERLLESIEENPDQVVFEVGGAYGNVAEAALELGVRKYYLNDCEEKHLKVFLNRMQQRGKQHLLRSLEMVLGRCPEEVHLEEKSYDALLVNKVLHFFTPETIDVFVEWMRKALKKGGKAYIFLASPFLPGDAPLLAEYEAAKGRGERFPGYFPNYGSSDASQWIEAEARPTSVLYMEIDTLTELFQDHGFHVDETFEVGFKEEQDPPWCPGIGMVGVIISKPV